MSADEKHGSGGKRAAPRTMRGVGAPSPIVAPADTGAGSHEKGGWSREQAPTDLGFVPPPDAPKVELSPTLEAEAVIAAAFPPREPKRPKAREAAAPTELMPDVQKRKAEAGRESSLVPLKIALAVLAVVIAGLVTLLAYGIVVSTR